MKLPEDSLYQVRDGSKLEPHYSKHVSHMTSENLMNKSDIAGELALRDVEIERLKKIWEAVSDVLMAEGNKGFEVRCGGMAALKLILKRAVNKYEEFDSSVEEGGI